MPSVRSGRFQRTGWAFALILALASAPGLTAQQASQSPAFEKYLNQFRTAPANPCLEFSSPLDDLEFHLFDAAGRAVAEALNRTPPAAAGPVARARATEVLKRLESLSAQVNHDWPEDNRFHFEAIDQPPGFLVKMTFRIRATFSFFAISEPEDRDKPDALWKEIGATGDQKVSSTGGYESFEFYPLLNSPAGNSRFLAVSGFAACGSGSGVSYTAYQWDPESHSFESVIELASENSQYPSTGEFKPLAARAEDVFQPIGELQTSGPVIALPYCWYSAIDTWHNPTLCAVNSYDLSGERVRFAGAVVNRPDLLPIAKTIQYAQARDYPAVLAYSGSPELAGHIVAEIPPSVWAGLGLGITQLSSTRERVEMEKFQFEVEERDGRWLVVAFHAKP
jgi:hypothetical protein